MEIQHSEFPKHPLPNIPQPEHPRAQQPMVYVYEKQGWEYRVVSKSAADESSLTEDELNALGESGWELVGIVSVPTKLQFYFKRVRT